MSDFDESIEEMRRAAWREDVCRQAVTDLSEALGEIPRVKSIVRMEMSSYVLAEARRRFGHTMRYALPRDRSNILWEPTLGPPRGYVFHTIDIRLDHDPKLAMRDVRVHYSDGSTLLVPL